MGQETGECLARTHQDDGSISVASVLTKVFTLMFRGRSESPGRVLIDMLAPGTYRAAASKGNFCSEEVSFSVKEGETADIRLVLLRR